MVVLSHNGPVFSSGVDLKETAAAGPGDGAYRPVPDREVPFPARPRSGDVQRVVAGIPHVVQTQTGFDYEADSVLNAQMSLRYNIAVAMYDGQAYLEQFTPERIVEPRVVELARRVEIEVHEDVDAAYPEIYGGRVILVREELTGPPPVEAVPGSTAARGAGSRRSWPASWRMP